MTFEITQFLWRIALVLETEAKKNSTGPTQIIWRYSSLTVRANYRPIKEKREKKKKG